MLTKGLQNLRAQIRAWAPDADQASSGWIGDAAHQGERSGHNPDDTPGSLPEWDGDPDSTPEVRAIDVDKDLRNGATMQQLVDHIVGLRPWTLRYVIYNRRIWEASNGWASRAYTGSNPHTDHAHFSGAYTQSADNDTTYNYRLEDIPMALTDDDKAWIGRAIEQHVREGLVGSPNYRSRTRQQFEDDVAQLRGLLVGDDKDGQSIPADAPIRRIIGAADRILSQPGPAS